MRSSGRVRCESRTRAEGGQSRQRVQQIVELCDGFKSPTGPAWLGTHDPEARVGEPETVTLATGLQLDGNETGAAGPLQSMLMYAETVGEVHVTFIGVPQVQDEHPRVSTAASS